MRKETLATLEYERIISLLEKECATVIGKELARALLPSSEAVKVRERLAETAEAVMIYATASPPIGSFTDIRSALEKARLGAEMEPGDFVNIRGALLIFREVKSFFKTLGHDSPILKTRALRIEILGEMERRMDNVLDEHGAIRDDASPSLKEIRADMRSLEKKLKSGLQKLLHSDTCQKYLQDQIVTIRQDRYVVPVKQEYRREIPGIVHDRSPSGATLFIEPMESVSLNNDLKELALREHQEIIRILTRLSADVLKNHDAIIENLEIIANIDLAFAKARLARNMHASEPVISSEGCVRLTRVRHPLLPASTVVPIDIELGLRYRMLLITGPNTGGKTVSMKTLGLVSLMAQSGLFIPADVGSELPVYREIFADIGDEQSIEGSLSTFSSHLKNIIVILSEVSENDLLLLDEIGAGTDPEEGASLATAILERLLEMRAHVAATTHYSALKAFAMATDGVENASVEFDEETLSPTYRLTIGFPGASNAFAISGRIGLDADIIERAKELTSPEHMKFERVIEDLEREKRLFEERSESARQSEIRGREFLEKYEKLEREIFEKKSEILRKARNEGTATIRRARREAEEIIDEFKTRLKESDERERRQAIADTRKKLQDAAGRTAPIMSYPDKMKKIDPSLISAGDSVYITALAQKGKILEIHGKELVVELGSMRTTVPINSCRFVSHGAEEKDDGSHPSGRFLGSTQNVRREIDIRGMMVDEGEVAVGKFIDDASLSGLKEVLIIHGKGTGALRRGIHEYLKRSGFMYNFADISEGGTGATVVKIK